MLVIVIFYVLSVLSAGLFAGLMMTLVVILQQQWDLLEKHEYVRYFKGFLLVAKGNPVITFLTLASFIFPLVNGLFHFFSGNSIQGMIMIIAGVVFFIGCFLVTMKLNFPIYNKVIGWTDAETVHDWEDVRKRFLILNIIRMTSALITFVLLIIGGLIS
jgi:uncharacterized membrane protein